MRVSKVLFVPAHTVAEPATDPPTDPEVTVTVASDELAGAQIPFVTTALYLVVVTRFNAV